MGAFKTVAVFCGSSLGNDPVYAQEMRDLARSLAQEGVHVYFGGITGKNGLLDIFHDEFTKAGGMMTAYVSQAYYRPAVAHHSRVAIVVVKDEFERGQRMLEADAAIMGPGSLGSFGEGCLALSMNLSRTYQAQPLMPLVFLSVPSAAFPGGPYAKIPALVDDFIRSGFSQPEAHKLFAIAHDAKSGVSLLKSWAEGPDVTLNQISSVAHIPSPAQS
ncbi:MAG: LOG family protein [Alphaproteobacteria bacterium]|nr:LOG family protein [Alphaproteobacteria bacterium]